jgi:serine/threonine protein phosphatase PrpC
LSAPEPPSGSPGPSVASAAAAPAELFVEHNDAAPSAHAFCSGRAVVFSARSPDKERPNEDAAALIRLSGGRGVLAVADGLGGQPAGAQASAAALKALAKALIETDASIASLREAVLHGFDRANKAVLDLGLGAATTLAVVELDGKRARSYHVGDSQTLIFGGRGRMKLATIAHSPVGYAVEAGLLDEREAMHHEARHLVSNILGSDEMRVEMSAQRRLAQRDTIVIASDGLCDNLHIDEIVKLLRKGPLEEAVARLIDEAKKRMTAPKEGQPSKPDDLTVVAFRPGAAGRASKPPS